ncbi:hypothetical protein GCM10027160_10840 [Streptomyces calidiresistens]|uniref:SagB/ThcOx family dehydrogenase n=1 Tax=Streptomyces calidiresistens TaxID=1485586 RepID=A0A7W3T0Y2_9ACTN|nr:SagB family peptide dehydrogenase [Streptomyces calidiresistens]MBB0228887.1 SagB/ThcOx family dehydrogenase [Streptomyces calidiresistens]
MTDERVDTSNLVDIVYRGGIPGRDDPAENYFEASKLYPSSVPWDLPGMALLERNEHIRAMTARSTRRHPGRPTVPLPEPAPLGIGLAEALEARRSTTVGFGEGEIGFPVVAGLLVRSYGISGSLGGHSLRPAPSAGALYPLDIHVVPGRVPGLRTGGRYHFDPFRRTLSDLGDVDPGALHASLNTQDLDELPALTLIISAAFWRSRFKYGQRALRFALMEAGHVAQNLLLVAAGHGLASRPIGGFFDSALTEELPDHNGVDDAPLYALLFGVPKA